MVTYFALIDSIRRHYPHTFDSRLGQFCASAGAATFGFLLVWPLEVLKVRPAVERTRHERLDEGM
jgi:hypothetical protein